MISCISPDIGNVEPTMNTLRYSDRVKMRNPTSGALPSSCPEPTRKLALFQPLTVSQQSSSLQVQLSVSDHSDCEDSAGGSAHVVTSTDNSTKFDGSSSPPSEEKDEATARLIADHHRIATEWLKMTRMETQLINEAQDFFDEGNLLRYYDQIETIQAQQRAWMSKLRKVCTPIGDLSWKASSIATTTHTIDLSVIFALRVVSSSLPGIVKSCIW
jgi:hypothetical protein